MSTQTLNLTPALYQYFLGHAFRESNVLMKLRQETQRRFPDMAMMEISPEQGQFMHLLIKAMQATKILEIGTFTGYSALWMAEALPEKGMVITCDIDPETTALAQDFWHQAKLDQKIILKLGNAADTLPSLLSEGGANSFDFAFIDADKTGYDFYYEQCLLLVRPGGIIAIDNTLQNGKVADPNADTPNVKSLRQLNNKLVNDSRIILSMLPVSDGLTLALKL